MVGAQERGQGVRKNIAEPRILSAVAILRACRANFDQQRQAKRVDQEMPFPPVNSLALVISALRTTAISDLDTLAIKRRREIQQTRELKLN